MSTARMQFIETLIHLFHPQRSNNHRAKVLHPDSYLSLIGVVIGFSVFLFFSGAFNPQFGNILGYASDISIADVVAQTNLEREKGGLPALSLNGQLSQAAAAKANDMFTKQYWAHKSPDGVEPWAFISGAGYSYTAAGENLARDFMVTPDMIAAWMASPTHAANIMNPRYQEIGVAVVNGTLEGIETTLVVQMFGRPTAQQVVAQVTPEAPTQDLETVSVRVTAPQSPSPSEQASGSEELSTTPSSPVLADTAVTRGSIIPQKTFSPLELTKAFGMSVITLLIGTLLIDWFISHHRGTIRVVSKNAAHIIYLSAIFVIILFFKGGFVN